MNTERIQETLKPETTLEKQLLEDPEFIEGVLYGKPRPGHPEGEVLLHIREVLDNVEKYSHHYDRDILRLIALIHDTFKYKVDRTKPKTGENHHGMLARRFAEKYTKDIRVLEVIELHDEAYNSWCKGDRDGKWVKAEERARVLIDRLDDRADRTLELYLDFYQCDNETGDKTQDNVNWVRGLI